MAMALRPRASPCSMNWRYGSQALVDGFGRAGGPWLTSEGALGSVVTCMAGFG
jgi:hypothetical protein